MALFIANIYNKSKSCMISFFEIYWIFIIYTSKGPAGESPISTIISKLPYFDDGPPLPGNLTLGDG